MFLFFWSESGIIPDHLSLWALTSEGGQVNVIDPYEEQVEGKEGQLFILKLILTLV